MFEPARTQILNELKRLHYLSTQEMNNYTTKRMKPERCDLYIPSFYALTINLLERTNTYPINTRMSNLFTELKMVE